MIKFRLGGHVVENRAYAKVNHAGYWVTRWVEGDGTNTNDGHPRWIKNGANFGLYTSTDGGVGVGRVEVARFKTAKELNRYIKLFVEGL